MTAPCLRPAMLAGLLLASTALTAPAFAQVSQPAHRAVDANGVDLISGTFPFNFAEGSIGSGEGALSVTRTGANAAGVGNWQNMYIVQTVSGSVTTATVMLGDRSETFTSTSGGAFVAAQGNGATLTGGAHADFTYTGSDGTVIVFGAGIADQSGTSNLCGHANADPNGCSALALTVTRPNAQATAFDWDIHPNCSSTFNPDGSLDCTYGWRLGTVSNSYGYAIDFSYVSNSASLHMNPPPDWFKRAGATLSNGGTTRTVSYNFVSSTVTEITDDGGRVWRLTTGTNSFAIRRPGSSSDDISVTTSGGIVTQVVRDGVATTYVRSVSGSNATTTITDALNNVTTVVADTSLARITSVTDPLTNQIQYQYDGSGRLTRVTRPEGDYTAYTYDGRGNLTETRNVAKSGSSLPDMVASATYASTCTDPTCNEPQTTTDVRGNTTDYTYDTNHGGILTVTGPAPASGATRPQTRYAWTLTNGEYRLTAVSACATGSTASSPSCVGTVNESRVVLAYDSNGNVTSVERRSGNTSGTGALTATTAYTYNDFGDVLTVDGPLTGSDDTVRYRYNAARQVIGVIGPDPDGGSGLHHRAVRTSYGTDGQVSSVERGNVDSQSDADWASFATLDEADVEYDAHHRPVVQRLASGGTTYQLGQASYDALGRAECVAQRMNPATFAALPSDACTAATTSATFGTDRITRTSFDAAGRVSLVETGYGVSGVAADEAAFTYTDNGRVETVTDAEDHMTSYEYDGHDRLVKTLYPEPSTPNASSATDYEQLAYETVAGGTQATPVVVSLRMRSSVTNVFDHDALGRLTQIHRNGGGWGEYDGFFAYDNLGRLVTATSGNTQALSFAYDALGRQTSETSSFYGTVSASQYDLAGRRTRLTWRDGYYVDYLYDTAGDMTEIRENGATSGAGQLAVYAYNDRGLRTGVTLGNGESSAWSYDAVGRLTGLSHDLGGSTNDVAFAYTLNPAGQIASRSTSNIAYSYNAFTNGSVTSTANGRNQVTAIGANSVSHDSNGNVSAYNGTSYAYTSDNMLATAGSEHYAYDAAQRLYYQNSDGQVFHYDGQQLIMETNASAIVSRYVPGPGLDEPVVWYDGSGTSSRRWLHADEHGSILAATNGSGALVGSINRYDDYGNVQGGAASERFGYAGQPLLASGLSYNRARMYNPTLDGRFMQPDPIGYGAGMNIYSYVRNDPANFSDPLGLDCPEDPDNCVTVTGGISPQPQGPIVRHGSTNGLSPREVSDILSGWGNGWSYPECTVGDADGHVTVVRIGDNVSITGNIEFFKGDLITHTNTPVENSSPYLNAINRIWSGNFGRYSVDTNMTEGPAGLTAYIGAVQGTTLGGPLYLPPVAGSPGDGYFMAFERIVGHEFGHSIGLSLQPGQAHLDGGIMANNAPPSPKLESHITKVLQQCR